MVSHHAKSTSILMYVVLPAMLLAVVVGGCQLGAPIKRNHAAFLPMQARCFFTPAMIDRPDLSPALADDVLLETF